MSSANVRAFPLDRQTTLVREVAARLGRLHGDTANSFWKATARELLDKAVAAGSDTASAANDVRRFFAAVQDEMHFKADDAVPGQRQTRTRL
ncbi:DUF6074 family protein [Mesorhizobium neociceri]|uniref:Uncharacterized protein n=1 Tax=Mesorhizobium neociceri TaxID=1307853 RepID=A0A838BDG2_9HYPH|nr:DUF6074 family protein [Mesorhizobium neociceri]MBA1144302.1 hypothetical protein [Mesorhizobium neociceri]